MSVVRPVGTGRFVCGHLITMSLTVTLNRNRGQWPIAPHAIGTVRQRIAASPNRPAPEDFQSQEIVNVRLTEKLRSHDFFFLPATISFFYQHRDTARPRGKAVQSAPTETVARTREPFRSAVLLLACRLVGSLRKRLGASSSQACSARSSAS